MERREHRFFSWRLVQYLNREVLFGFISGTTIFLLIMLMFQAIRLADFVVIHQVSALEVGRLCVFLMLSFMPIAVPIAFLFAVLMGISRANSEGEILALQASGISLEQIFAPVSIFSVGIATICLYGALYTVPHGNRAFELLVTRLGNERAIAALKPGVFRDFFGLVLFAEQIVPVRNELKRVFIYDLRDEVHPLAISAEAGILRNGPDGRSMTLRLSEGAIQVENPDPLGSQQKIEFSVYDINLELSPRSEAWRDYSPPSYNFSQLRQRIRETVSDPPYQRQLLVELHRRFSLSFSCVVFAALGFFIGTLSKRGVRSTAILLCLAVALAYWICYVAASALAVSGWITPWLAVWFPNFIFVGVAYYCYRRYAGA